LHRPSSFSGTRGERGSPAGTVDLGFVPGLAYSSKAEGWVANGHWAMAARTVARLVRQFPAG